MTIPLLSIMRIDKFEKAENGEIIVQYITNDNWSGYFKYTIQKL
jgi:hypothetical protein